MRKTYKFKAKMSREAESNCHTWLSLCCDLYNSGLNQRREAYRKNGISLNNYTQSKELPDIKSDLPEFKQVSAQTLQQVLDRVDKAYKLFFSNLKAKNCRAGLPRYKSKSRYDSFTLKQTGWRLDGNKLYIKNIGVLKLYLSREIQGDIKQITVKRDSCGDWFVAFSCDNVPAKEYVDFTDDAVGIDVGLSSFLTDSEGVKIENPRWFRESQTKLRKQQRRVSHRKKGSNRRKKAQKQVAKTHRKASRQRRDFHFKLANQYVARYGAICIEKLQISNMVKNNKLSKSINDAGWSQFKEILTFKAEEAGRLVIEVDPKFSSQDCSECGNRVKKELWQRVHDCKQCGLRIDRDHNSAIVLKKRGLGQSLQALT